MVTVINLRKCLVVACLALIVVTAATTSSASDVPATVLVPLDPLFGLVILAVSFVAAVDDELPPAPALSIRRPRAPPAA
jgi:hypothetical protein